MAEAITPRSARGHLVSVLLCVFSMGIGAFGTYTLLNTHPSASAAISSKIPEENAAHLTRPTTMPAEGVQSATAPNTIRAYYTNAQSGATTASVFPVATAGASAPCGRSVSSTPLCQGVQVQCEPAPDGVYRWTLQGFCE